MRSLPVTTSYSILMDDADFEWASKFRWYAHGGSDRVGTRPARRAPRAEGGKIAFFHHHILAPRGGMVVDHINGDPWDNRRPNLRLCTGAENSRNRQKHKWSARTPFKGVVKNFRRWRATIMGDGERFRLGHYDTAEAAALAYDAAALWLHKEFARLNFPDAGTAPRSPADILASCAPADRGHGKAVRAQVLARINAGARVAHVAKELGVPPTTVARWVAAA